MSRIYIYIHIYINFHSFIRFLPVCLSVCLSVSLSLCLTVCLIVSLCLSLSVCLSLSLSFSLSVSPPLTNKRLINQSVSRPEVTLYGRTNSLSLVLFRVCVHASGSSISGHKSASSGQADFWLVSEGRGFEPQKNKNTPPPPPFICHFSLPLL